MCRNKKLTVNFQSTSRLLSFGSSSHSGCFHDFLLMPIIFWSTKTYHRLERSMAINEELEVHLSSQLVGIQTEIHKDQI